MSETDDGFKAAYNALMQRLHMGANQHRPIDAWAQYGETPEWGNVKVEGNAISNIPTNQTIPTEVVPDPVAGAAGEPVKKSLTSLVAQTQAMGVSTVWGEVEAAVKPETFQKALEHLTRASLAKGYMVASDGNPTETSTGKPLDMGNTQYGARGTCVGCGKSQNLYHMSSAGKSEVDLCNGCESKADRGHTDNDPGSGPMA